MILQSKRLDNGKTVELVQHGENAGLLSNRYSIWICHANGMLDISILCDTLLEAQREYRQAIETLERSLDS